MRKSEPAHHIYYDELNLELKSPLLAAFHIPAKSLGAALQYVRVSHLLAQQVDQGRNMEIKLYGASISLFESKIDMNELYKIHHSAIVTLAIAATIDICLS